MNTLQELFEYQLEDMYYTEHRLVTALEKMVAESSDPLIARAFALHLEQTRGHTARLEQVFTGLREGAAEIRSLSVEGLAREGDVFARRQPGPTVRDLFNLSAGAKAEHHEIAAYQSLIALASRMGLHREIEALSANLREEEEALSILNQLTQKTLAEHTTGVAVG